LPLTSSVVHEGHCILCHTITLDHSFSVAHQLRICQLMLDYFGKYHKIGLIK